MQHLSQHPHKKKRKIIKIFILDVLEPANDKCIHIIKITSGNFVKKKDIQITMENLCHLFGKGMRSRTCSSVSIRPDRRCAYDWLRRGRVQRVILNSKTISVSTISKMRDKGHHCWNASSHHLKWSIFGPDVGRVFGAGRHKADGRRVPHRCPPESLSGSNQLKHDIITQKEKHTQHS